MSVAIPTTKKDGDDNNYENEENDQEYECEDEEQEDDVNGLMDNYSI